MNDIDDKPALMSVVSHMSLRKDGGVGALYNSGTMFGMNYMEPYMVVKDARADKSRLYSCTYGCTMQGNYTTAFVLAQSPTLGKVAETKVAQVAESIGLRYATLYKQQYMLRLDAFWFKGDICARK